MPKTPRTRLGFTARKAPALGFVLTIDTDAPEWRVKEVVARVLGLDVQVSTGGPFAHQVILDLGNFQPGMLGRIQGALAIGGHAGRTTSTPSATPSLFDVVPATTTCRGCKADVDPLEIFPGDRCLECHKVATAGDRMPTARELARMWGSTR